MSTPGLEAALERFRRHAGLSAGASAALAAASATAVVTECIRWYWFTPGPGRFSTVVPAALTAGVITVAAAWLRRPSPREVARTIDATLSLQAAIVTAYQCRDERDVFAVRTVTRAAEALSASRPADVYPWRLSRTTLGLIGVSVAGWLVLLMSSGWRSDTTRPSGGVAGSSPAGVPGRATPSTARPGAPRSSERTSPESGPATGAGRATPEHARATPSPPPRTTPDAAQAPEGGGRTPDQQGDMAMPSRSTADASGTDAARAVADGARRPASLSSRDAPGQPGRGTAAPGGGRPGTGGRATSPSSGRTGANRDGTTTGQPSAADEQALALERVPMSRRTYVQHYLESLR